MAGLSASVGTHRACCGSSGNSARAALAHSIHHRLWYYFMLVMSATVAIDATRATAHAMDAGQPTGNWNESDTATAPVHRRPRKRRIEFMKFPLLGIRCLPVNFFAVMLSYSNRDSTRKMCVGLTLVALIEAWAFAACL